MIIYTAATSKAACIKAVHFALGKVIVNAMHACYITMDISVESCHAAAIPQGWVVGWLVCSLDYWLFVRSDNYLHLVGFPLFYREEAQSFEGDKGFSVTVHNSTFSFRSVRTLFE